ncbi:LacI family DNA-binding transcriptional regulator [Microlunatus capsulatus]|uniref:LacI family transcriptional regulator n=1 Tax=Microlunatus capsulatus TaxID=99117 RepID=A0ABS4ZDN0_9ACTN|nr:substrate-binding domain-containing protein [Microlunatus capsulatus]MBP2419163.1 LacI family transcriptional regulator [Microlunatus capsulatus]
MTKDGRPTLETVAVAAGVSLATVSKVLNDRRDVAAATRLRVQELLDEYEYVPPRRSPVHRDATHRRFIELVFTALDSPYSVEIMRGVVSCPVDVVVTSAPDTPDGRGWSGRFAPNDRSGAIIVTSQLTPADQRELARARVPYVLIDPAAELASPEVSTVGATNWAGGLAATQHLLGLGHRRIAAIGGPAAMLCTRARISGYSAALASAGVRLDPELIRHGRFHHRGGHQAAQELFALPDPPTAIFAGSDEQAFGVAEAARLTGRRIPDDLSLVGFDDLPMARWFSPPLTTVRQPLTEMGRTAASMLLGMIEDGEPHGRQVELATELVVRSSTAPPPGRTGAGPAR